MNILFENMNIINDTAAFVQEKLKGEGSGHDWWHVYRVWKMAKHIAEEERGVDIMIVELGALLHDIADWKFHEGDETVGPRMAREWLISQGVDSQTVSAVCHIVERISYKGAGVENDMKSKEGLVVQDADRLDAIGAIGIARAFAYGGYTGRQMYDPAVKPELHQTPDAYKKNNGPTINHFYEKLLLLKDRMNTRTAKKIAQERHQFMEEYLDRFYEEWEGRI